MIEAAAAAAAQIQAEEEEAEEEDTFQDNEVARRPRVSRFRSSIALSHNSSTVTQTGAAHEELAPQTTSMKHRTLSISSS